MKPSDPRRSPLAQRAFVMLCALFLCASGARAQLSVKQVQAQMKQQIAEATKELRISVAAELKDLALDIKAARQQALGGDADLDAVKALFDELVAFQIAVTDAHDTSRYAYSVKKILEGLNDDADLDSFYPTGFLDGDGGIRDQFKQRNAHIVSQAYARVRKQLGGYAKAADKGSDLLLSFAIREAPAPRYFANNAVGASQSSFVRTRLDLLVGYSFEDGLASDRRLFARGTSGKPASFVVSAQGVNITKLSTSSQIKAGVTLGGPGSDDIERGNLLVQLVVTNIEGIPAGDEWTIGIR